MNGLKDKHRKLARESYWDVHNRGTYKCPDCGRTEDEIMGRFEVHHKNGEPLDNRLENRVALCRVCHNLREGKKPSIERIELLRSQLTENSNTGACESDKPSVYLAGSMDGDGGEHDAWRASIADRGDRVASEYSATTPLQIYSPTEVSSSHGCGVVEGITSADMKLVDKADAIVAYFEKEEQVGTLTELVYAVTTGKPALVLFDSRLINFGDPSKGIDVQNKSPVYWFLINFLTGDGWDGLRGESTIRVVGSKDEIKSEFNKWDWHNKKRENTGEIK